MEDLTVLLPAKDEEASIGLVIEEVRKELPGCKILVIDNGSKDRTQEISLNMGAEVLYYNIPGKGNAVKFGLSKITTDYVVMMNSDHTYPAGYARLLYSILKNGNPEVDVVVGYRALLEKDSITGVNKFGNWCLSSLASFLYLRKFYDICSGMWAFKTKVVKQFNIKSSGFTLEADLLTNTLRRKFELEQVPIGYRKRVDGSKSHLKIGDGLKIGLFLVGGRFGNNK